MKKIILLAATGILFTQLLAQSTKKIAPPPPPTVASIPVPEPPPPPPPEPVQFTPPVIAENAPPPPMPPRPPHPPKAPKKVKEKVKFTEPVIEKDKAPA